MVQSRVDMGISLGYSKSMPKNPPRGRPALPDSKRRGTDIKTRVTDAEKREIDEAAKAAGLASSAWIRSTLLLAARAAGGR
jgi:hypothetical protein